jgi:hypothetical protein
MMLALRLALGTICDAIREPLLPQMFKASVIGWKLTVEIFDCVPKVSRNCLLAVHNGATLAKTERDVKG